MVGGEPILKLFVWHGLLLPVRFDLKDKPYKSSINVYMHLKFVFLKTSSFLINAVWQTKYKKSINILP